MFIGYELWMEGNDEGKAYVVKLKLVTFGEDLEPMSPFNHAALCDCCKYHISSSSQGFPSVAVAFPSANEGDMGLIPGSRRSPEVGMGGIWSVGSHFPTPGLNIHSYFNTYYFPGN